MMVIYEVVKAAMAYAELKKALHEQEVVIQTPMFAKKSEVIGELSTITNEMTEILTQTMAVTTTVTLKWDGNVLEVHLGK